MDPQWLRWAKRLQAIAQEGLTYTKDHYDVERYVRIREIAAEIVAGNMGWMPPSSPKTPSPHCR